jgi:hypothetical protein
LRNLAELDTPNFPFHLFNNKKNRRKNKKLYSWHFLFVCISYKFNEFDRDKIYRESTIWYEFYMLNKCILLYWNDIIQFIHICNFQFYVSKIILDWFCAINFYFNFIIFFWCWKLQNFFHSCIWTLSFFHFIWTFLISSIFMCSWIHKIMIWLNFYYL